MRWLRPDYQIPRFGSDAEKARLEGERRRAKAEKEHAAPEQAALLFDENLPETKPPFPTGRELEETVAVMRVLEAAAAPMSVGDIARHFAQGKQIEKRAALVVAALARLGHLASADGGKTVTLRAA